MSYRCDVCKEPQAPRERPIRVVVETRQKTYKERGREIGHGTETVKELGVCGSCSLELKFGKHRDVSMSPAHMDVN